MLISRVSLVISGTRVSSFSTGMDQSMTSNSAQKWTIFAKKTMLSEINVFFLPSVGNSPITFEKYLLFLA